MAFTPIHSVGAFSSGAATWLAPDLNHSRWSRLLDWYLNMQISRVQHVPRPQLAPPLINLINQHNAQFAEYQSPAVTPLLILTAGLLPAHSVVLIPELDSADLWIQSVHHVWDQLGRTTARLFLPKGLSPSQVSSLWPHSMPDVDISLVEHWPDSPTKGTPN